MDLHRLDYSNSLLTGITKSDMQKLQKAQNSLDRVIANKWRNEHITLALTSLYSFLFRKGFFFKLGLMVLVNHSILNQFFFLNLVSPSLVAGSTECGRVHDAVPNCSALSLPSSSLKVHISDHQIFLDDSRPRGPRQTTWTNFLTFSISAHSAQSLVLFRYPLTLKHICFELFIHDVPSLPQHLVDQVPRSTVLTRSPPRTS